jgi:hypothetical protein
MVYTGLRDVIHGLGHTFEGVEESLEVLDIQ